ncbi:MAG: hypothetical protein KAI16_02375 [Candidatus Pacebacteria bacterium]|nr:hypothetical protein [Candidatus Paceibacterota bacterium]
MKKFTRDKDTKYKKGNIDIVLIIIFLFFISIIGGIWYYQQEIYTPQDLETRNQMQDLEVERQKLLEEIEKIQGGMDVEED